MIHHVASEIKPQHDSIWIPAFLLHFPCLHFLYGRSHIFSLFYPCFSFFPFACFSSSVITSCLSILHPPPCSLLRGRHSFLECCTNLRFTCSRVHLKYPSMHQLTSAPAGKKSNMKDKRTRLQSSASSFTNFLVDVETTASSEEETGLFPGVLSALSGPGFLIQNTEPPPPPGLLLVLVR